MSGIRSALVYIYFPLEDHHVRTKDDGHIGRRMLWMELPGKRTRRRPTGRFMDAVREDMAEVEVKQEDTEDRNNWR